jgi:membrane peptidoglycan carboxypeptidase
MNALDRRLPSGRRVRAGLNASWTSLGGRRRSALRRVLAVLIAVVMVTVLAGGVYASTLLSGLPSVQDENAANFRGDTLIYDRGGRSGTLLADVGGNNGEHRMDVSLDQVAPKLVEATVAVEDRSFWTNPGFDPTGIARAALADIRHETIVGGGSTITQQLAKQLFLTPDQTLQRKVKELVLAWELSHTYSKQQIMELYLNTNLYGEQEYGVEAASQAYFHKHAKDLDLAQAALLAGLPQAPSQYDPVTHFDAAKARQKEVLEAMVRVGDIQPAEAAQAAQEPLHVFPPTSNYLAPHFVGYVLGELERLGFKPGQQQLRVTTTLDYGKQRLGENIVRSNLKANRYRDPAGQLSSALVSMDPKTGQILAYVGSPDYNDPHGGQIDFVNGRDINPGSSVKPYTYAAAIANRKATMDTPIPDYPSPFVVPMAGQKPYVVYDYDKRSHGLQPLRVAFASSLNIPAVRVELAVGMPQLIQFWRQFGLRPLDLNGNPNGPPDNYGPATTLGAAPITLLQHVAGLSVFANMGVYHQPEAILQVTDAQGNVLYQADPTKSAKQVIDPGVAYIISSIIADDNNRALIFGRNSPLHLPDRHAAAKTGTTDNFKDALTVGWTPNLTTVVWVGDILDSSHTMFNGSDGVYVAAPAWHAFMEGALKGVPDRWYQPPSDVVKGSGNSWYLQGATNITSLSGPEQPAGPPEPDYGVPPDPHSGPVLLGPDGRRRQNNNFPIPQPGFPGGNPGG